MSSARVSAFVPQYLKRSKNKKSAGIYYVVVPIPSDRRWAFGGKRTLERSLNTRDGAVAAATKGEWVTKFKAQIAAVRSSPEATRGDHLIALAESVRTEQDEVNAEASIDAYIDDKPNMPPTELAKVRRANSILSGTADDLLDRQAKLWLKTQASKGLVAGTLKDKELQIAHLLGFVGVDATPECLTKALAVDYVEQVLNPMDVSAIRKGLILRAAVAFADWLELRGRLRSNPFQRVHTLIRAQDKRRAPRRGFTPDQVGAMLGGLLDGKYAQRAKATSMARMVALMAFTGARPQELTDVRVADVFDGMLHIPDSKTKNGLRMVPIHATIAELIDRLKDQSSDGYLFSGLKATDGNRYRDFDANLQRFVKDLFEDDGLVPYSLRRTVVGQLEAAGTSAWVQDAIIGHEVDEGDRQRRGKRSVRETNYLDDPGFQRKAEALSYVDFGPAVAALVSRVR